MPLGPGTIFEYDLAEQNPAQENCCTQNIYQVGVGEEDLHRTACLVLACHIAGPSAYERLRTQEQLGYIVQAWCWTEQYVCGLSVLVQGARMSPAEVDIRIEAWLEKFEEELEKMSEEDFATNVQAVISAQTQRYARMAQETAQHWSEIASRRFCFDRLARSVESLEALSKKDVVAFFREYLAASATQRRKLSVRILGTSAGQARSEPKAPDGQVLGDLGAIREFKAACETYPVPEPAKVPA